MKGTPAEFSLFQEARKIQRGVSGVGEACACTANVSPLNQQPEPYLCRGVNAAFIRAAEVPENEKWYRTTTPEYYFLYLKDQIYSQL